MIGRPIGMGVLHLQRLDLGEKLLHIAPQQSPERPCVLEHDAKLPVVDSGAVCVTDDMAKPAQVVEKRKGFIGDGGRPDPGYRDAHPPEKRRVISAACVDMVLAGDGDDLEQTFRRAEEVVKLEGQALATRRSGHPFPIVDSIVDGGDLEELRSSLRREH